MKIFYLLSLFVLLGCALSKSKENKSEVFISERETFIYKDTLHFFDSLDSVRITYTYENIMGKKTLKSIIQEKKIDLSGNGEKHFRVFQEIYFHNDGMLKAVYNTKNIKISKENIVMYDQDQFFIDSEKKFSAMRITDNYQIILDLFVFKEKIIDMTQGKDGLPVYDYDQPTSLEIKPIHD